ncbi:unnamed protein product [Symbiodinium natans]|uniref:Uncharacterized protein n=1 Tax=Symbiodinium natans TaxID=878477 RepID=A0A812T9F4_9DINO|nr:unnamed protein product [Symbiodinium natans]
MADQSSNWPLDEQRLNLFPKSSGPPGPPDLSLQAYIRRRVGYEVEAAMTEMRARQEASLPSRVASFLPASGIDEPPLPVWAQPPDDTLDATTARTTLSAHRQDVTIAPSARSPPPCPPPSLLTLAAGGTSLTIHDASLAERVLSRGLQAFCEAASSSTSSHRNRRRRSERSRSRSPLVRVRPPQHPQGLGSGQNQSLPDSYLGSQAAGTSTVIAAFSDSVLARGPALPEPSEVWHPLPTLPNQPDIRFQYVGSPAMLAGRTDVQHVIWPSFHCLHPVAGLVVEHFDPANTKASHPLWKAVQRLLQFFRSAILNDQFRIRAAFEINSPAPPFGGAQLQERWLAAVLSSADAQARYN